jgi:hypothetical protein
MTTSAHRYLAILLSAVFLEAGAAAQEKFSSISSAHFDIKYQGTANEDDVRALLEFLERDYDAITADLGLDSTRRLEVRLYASVGRYLSAVNLRQSWRGAYYTRGVLHLQPIKDLLKARILETSIGFELATALLDDAWARGCPPWLLTSYAVYHADELRTLSPPMGVRVQTFADLDQELQEHPDPPSRDDLHYVLGQTMMFFIQEYGTAKAFGVFSAFDGERPVEQVFESVFGAPYDKIETRWHQYLTSVLPALKR